MTDKQRLVFFNPQPDITPREAWIFVGMILLGLEASIYPTMPLEWQRHFQLQERDE